MPPRIDMGRKGPGGPGARGAKPKEKPKNTVGTVKRLLGYITGYKKHLTVAVICVCANTASTLTASYMLRPLINKFIDPTTTGGRGDPAGLAKGLAVMALVYLVGLVATYTQSRIMISLSQGVLATIRNDLFSKLERLPVRYFDQNNTGDIMSRFTNDVDTVGEMLNNTLLGIFSGAITLVGTLVLMIKMNIWLTIVTVVMIPVFAKAAGWIAGRSRKFFTAQQAALGEVNSYIEESVTGSKVVKVFCREDKSVEEFAERNSKLKENQMKAQFAGGITGPVMGNLSQLNYALTGCVGCILCLMGRFDVGGLTVFVNFSRQFSRPINELSMQLTTIMSALAGAERVFAVMDTEPEGADSEDAVEIEHIKGDVRLDNVTFGYDPGRTILKNVTIWAKPGQKIALVGSTGAGKTTITNLITRFYEIDEGTITIDGVDIKKLKKKFLRENIAVVLQDTHLFTGTVMENIRYSRPDATDEEVRMAAMTSCAHMFIKHLPDGYDTMLEGDGANLSQGQRQLLNIARAALSKAPVLILDEATSSVDTKTEMQINKAMDALMESRTTFVIAHRLSTIRNADAIMVLENGEIIERGTHRQLLDMKGRYYELSSGLKELD